MPLSPGFSHDTLIAEAGFFQDLSSQRIVELGKFLIYLLHECKYVPIRILDYDPETGMGTYATIMPLYSNHAIITGRIGDRGGYEDRWCYHSRASAEAALRAWSGTGEPEGWHRHPGSGRRREIEEGRILREYVAW